MGNLTHFDENGASRMVDVTEKPATERVAVAAGEITMRPQTLDRILRKGFEKGDVLEVARLAGIMAAKKVDGLIPLCHQINLTSVKLAFQPDEAHSRVVITAQVKCTAPTGVEMEALTAVSVAALTIYDMCKAMDREMVIGAVRLLEKSGGRSGHFVRDAQDRE
ncbi:GTP cyclohydrolase subunit MoaC [Magnetococcus marinus MC-1]|uniref:Cyclic pyranopterin monophosphate synthase n=1 Tax=Magnetococcus marinus (strain ATCC BAA-1437 / JCM 17883 / MC-1) TaxID=156889 RepID=MOAC_MAGMM|nr:cyclic pyranopterin monophosphate synthase MoaC [Magnetococcus marinus]A0L7R3.1 RecName: Full=Cyclic pyranopterin monophosphate synthase; AltName: Full=Molybdenum cofactor biosynthesis protein C [Magnetococcus marinus MC-1]ABK44006.1 GTP cyclohydrolase subunit MoaC [Magnetococcus marinus MC-1]